MTIPAGKTAASLVLAAFVCAAARAAEAPPVRITRQGGLLELENGLVKARLDSQPRRISRQFLARRGADWVLVAESFSPGNQFEERRAEASVFEDFEHGYGRWTTQGEAFGSGPAAGTFPGQQTLRGYGGQFLANSWRGNDQLTGRLVSRPFTITKDFIRFKIGGGNQPGKACLNLVVAGQTVRTATGLDDETLWDRWWDATEYRGREARLEIVDDATGGWGHINVDDIVFTALSPRQEPVALFDDTLNPYRHLVTARPGRVQARPGASDEEAAVELTMEHQGAAIVETLRLRRGETWFQVNVEASLPGTPARLDYLLSAFTFNLDHPPEFIHSPGQKFDDPRAGPGRDQITGDRAFHAPAVILQEGGLFTALAPDLEAINRYRVVSPDARRTTRIPRNIFSVPVEEDRYTMPAGIDLNVRSGLTPQPLFCYGLLDSIIGHHIRYQRVNDGSLIRTLSSNRVGYAFSLFLGADVPAQTGFQRVARLQWERYGHAVFQNRPHLAMPAADYWRLVYAAAFHPRRDPRDPSKLFEVPGGPLDAPLPGYADHGSWLEWETDGLPLGGFRSSIPWWNDVIHNSVFWNNAREALGFLYWGRRMNEPKLVENAHRIINFCLAAPRNPQGLFATVYSAGTRRWGLSFTDPPHGENRLFLRDAKSYDLAALSKTGAHLLDFYLRGEKDARIVAFLTPYADWLLTAIDNQGRVPAFVTVELQPSPILLDSAHPAASLWFLAEMHNATRREDCLRGARRIAEYLEREILPGAKWIDLEQSLSCGAKPYSLLRDEWQNQYYRGNLCLFWAAEGFAALHRAEGDTRWLRDGERCLDYLSFSQCVWDPHFIYTAFPFGGFTVDNSDTATMLDARQADAVRPFLWYGKILGRQDLLERGLAAARSSVVLINHPLHKSLGIYRHPNVYPTGLGPENIDHEGHPQSAMRTHPSWGEASGVFTGLAEAMRELGGAPTNTAGLIGAGPDGLGIQPLPQR